MTKTGRGSAGQLVFRWRSYLPLLVIGGLAYGLYHFDTGAATARIRACLVGGSILAASGLALRLYAVGHAPPGTSGRHRRQHAVALNTFGIYSIVRHPLYLGNVVIWIGVSLASGWLLGALVSSLLGVAMFAVIVRHEDAFLSRSFGAEFAEWSAVTPAFVPRFSLWRTARRPFRWARAIASEYSTLHSVGLLILLFAGLRSWAGAPDGEPGLAWWSLLVANSSLYLALRVWRARRKAARRSALPNEPGF